MVNTQIYIVIRLPQPHHPARREVPPTNFVEVSSSVPSCLRCGSSRRVAVPLGEGVGLCYEYARQCRLV